MRPEDFTAEEQQLQSPSQPEPIDMQQTPLVTGGGMQDPPPVERQVVNNEAGATTRFGLPKPYSAGIWRPQDPSREYKLEDWSPDRPNPALQRMAADENRRALASWKAAIEVSPEYAAEVSKLAQELGISRDAVTSNIDEARKLVRVMQFRKYGIGTGDPIVQRQLSDPEFAKLAQDDVRNLSTVESIFRWWNGIEDAYTEKSLQNQMGRLGSMMMTQVPGGPAQQETYREIAKLRMQMESLAPQRGFIGGFAGMVGQLLQPTAEATAFGAGVGGLFAAVSVAATRSTAAAPAAYRAGAAIGGGAYMLTDIFGQESGHQYISLMDELAPPGSTPAEVQRAHDAAKWSSVGTGIVNMGLEAIGMYGLAVAPVKAALTRSVTKKLGEAFRRPTLLEAARRAGIATAKGYAGELGTEYVQEVVGIRMEQLAKQYARPDLAEYMESDEGQEEIAQRLATIVEETIYAVGILGSIGPGTGLFIESKNIIAAKRHAAKLAAQERALIDSKIRKNAPDALASSVNEMAQEYDGKIEMYLDAEKLTQVLEELESESITDIANSTGMPEAAIRGEIPVSGKAMAQLRQLVPDVADQLTSLEDGTGDVKVTLGDYHSKLVGTELGRRLSKHLRESPDSLSAAEAEQAERVAREQLSENAEKVLAEVNQRAQFEREASVIEKDIRKQMLATKTVSKQEARLAAQTWRNMYITMAGRMKMTPAQLFKQVPFSAQREARDLFASDLGLGTITQQAVEGRQRRRNLLERKLQKLRERQAATTDEDVRDALAIDIAMTEDELSATPAPEVLAETRPPGSPQLAEEKQPEKPTLLYGRDYQNVKEAAFEYWDERSHGDEVVAMATMVVLEKIFGKGAHDRILFENAVIEGDGPELAMEVSLEIERTAEIMRAEFERQDELTAMETPSEARAMVEEAVTTDLLTPGAEQIESDATQFGPVEDAARIESANDFAKRKQWRTVRDLKTELQRNIRQAMQEAGTPVVVRSNDVDEDGNVIEGSGLVDTVSEAQDVEDYLVRVGTSDALFALRQNPNAVGWYDLKTRQALAVVARIFPEVDTDENARFAFVFALAVTSNGMRVNDNFILAVKAYKAFKITGLMPTDIGTGNAKKAINETLGLYNKLTKKFGTEQLRKLMLARGRAAVFSQITEKKVGGEYADTEVLGSAILGPKIGNGFFANLYGMFDQLTMDRWLIRTWGRWTGTLIVDRPELLENSRVELRKLISEISDQDRVELSKLLLETQKGRISEEEKTRMNQTPLWRAIRFLRDKEEIDANGIKVGVDKPKVSRKSFNQWAMKLGLIDKALPERGKIEGDLAHVANLTAVKSDRSIEDLAQEYGVSAEELVRTMFRNTNLKEAHDAMVEERMRQEGESFTGESILTMNIDELAKQINRASMNSDRRDVMNAIAGGVGADIRKRGNNLWKSLDGQKEAPQNPRERVQIRRVFSRILREIQQRPEFKNLTMADLQAVLWYAERRIYETAKQEQTDASSEVEGYVDAEAPDYAVAAVAVAREEGVSEEDIQKALRREEKVSERAAALERMAGGSEQPSGAAGKAARAAAARRRGFSARELKTFAGHTVALEGRLARGNAKGASWSVTRSPAAKRGGIGILATWSLGKILKNRYKSAGVNVTAEMMELDSANPESVQKFVDAINAFKSAKPQRAASVHAYTAQEYAGAKLFLSDTGKSGFAIMPDGEISSLWSDEGNARVMVDIAIAAGGKHANAFDIGLADLYAGHGLRVVSRVKFDPSQAPADWNYEHFKDFNGGRPDVVFMVFDPDYREFYTGTEGGRRVSYGAAVKIQQSALKRIEKEQAERAKQAPVPPDALTSMPSDRVLGTFSPSQFRILLFNKSNFRTVIHETGHAYMEMLFRLAAMPESPVDVKADAKVILDWFGIGTKDMTFEQQFEIWSGMTIDQQRPHHEAFALNFEKYSFSGKAPSLELQSAFDRFAAWLRNFYTNIVEELNSIYRRSFGRDLPMLTDDVRGVFDRMVAAEQEIQHAEQVNRMVAQFQTKEEAMAAGMTEEQWIAYSALLEEARESSVSQLTQASLKQLLFVHKIRKQLGRGADEGELMRVLSKLDAEVQQARRRIRAEVENEIANQPVYKARRWLRTGKAIGADGQEIKVDGVHKLHRPTVEQMVGGDQRKMNTLRSVIANGGLPPEQIGLMFGMSGTDLVEQLASAPELADAIETETDARLLKEFGDLNTKEDLRSAISAALSNEARSRFVAVEAGWLERAMLEVGGDMDAPTREKREEARKQHDELLARRAQLRDELRALQDVRRKTPENERGPTEKQYQEAVSAIEQQMEEISRAIGRQRRAMNAAIPARVMVAAKRMAAQKILGRTVVRELRPDRYTQAAGRAGQAAAAASKKNNMAKVLAEKNRQLLQMQMASEAQAIREEIRDELRFFKTLNKDDETLSKTRNMDLIRVARSILSVYGLGRSTDDMNQNLEFLREYNPELLKDVQPLLDNALQNQRSHRELTVNEFRLLAETVRALDEEARNAKLVEIEGQRIQMEQVRAEFAAATDRLPKPDVQPGTTSRKTAKEEARETMLNVRAHGRMVESYCYTLDGKQPVGSVGIFTKYLYRPMVVALQNWRTARNKYARRLKDLLDTIELPVGEIRSSELNWTFGGDRNSMGKAELIGALLHTGNDSNFRKLLLGYGWGEEREDGSLDSSRWDAFIDRMISLGVLTQKDFDYVQAVWDVTEEIYPSVQKAHRQVFGFDMDKIPFREVKNRLGTWRGGYVPAKADPSLEPKAARIKKMEDLQDDFRQTFPSAKSGFRHSRVDVNRKLLLDVRLVHRHVDEALLFVHAQPAAKQILRILRDDEIAGNINAVDPSAIEGIFMPWLVRSVRQISMEPGRDNWINRAWNALRRRGALPFMFANPLNALQQGTGLALTATRVNKRVLAKAFWEFMERRGELVDEIARLSPWMEERLHGEIQDIRENIDSMLRKPSLYNDALTWTEHNGYFLQRWMQNPVDIISWWGAYNEALAELPVELPKAERERRAALHADGVVRQTQGSRNPEDIASYEVNTPFWKAMFQFSGYSNMLANLNLANYQLILQDGGWRGGRGKNAYLLVQKYLMGFAMPMFLGAAIVQLGKGGWDDDEDDGYVDELLETFFGSQVKGALSMAPGIGQAALAGVNAFNDKTYDDRMMTAPSIAAVESSFRGAAQVYKYLTEDNAFTGRDLRDVLTMLTLMSGLPLSGLSRPGAFLLEVERGTQRPEDLYDWATGLGSGRVGTR